MGRGAGPGHASARSRAPAEVSRRQGSALQLAAGGAAAWPVLACVATGTRQSRAPTHPGQPL